MVAKRHKIISVSLLKKLRDIIFFWGQSLYEPFLGSFLNSGTLIVKGLFYCVSGSVRRRSGWEIVCLGVKIIGSYCETSRPSVSENNGPSLKYDVVSYTRECMSEGKQG